MSDDNNNIQTWLMDLNNKITDLAKITASHDTILKIIGSVLVLLGAGIVTILLKAGGF